ncbi:hypothetical protein Y1Q_0008520 [Alligator mississippiensis]|uniref:Reverse transcriptase RNase H-like domain-containing protein n=1 Tax=Alligator mississippiensis TaxID=8496 RepID=A0A151M1L6_ALLMI|nr:hypothetical protein Y1Q_0008520 [Alligator mississippiensis]
MCSLPCLPEDEGQPPGVGPVEPLPVIEIDASELAIRVVLTQEDTGIERLVAYTSHRLLTAEIWYRNGTRLSRSEEGPMTNQTYTGQNMDSMTTIERRISDGQR